MFSISNIFLFIITFLVRSLFLRWSKVPASLYRQVLFLCQCYVGYSPHFSGSMYSHLRSGSVPSLQRTMICPPFSTRIFPGTFQSWVPSEIVEMINSSLRYHSTLIHVPVSFSSCRIFHPNLLSAFVSSVFTVPAAPLNTFWLHGVVLRSLFPPATCQRNSVHGWH